MPAKPVWIHRLEEIRDHLTTSEAAVVDRTCIEALFHVRRRRAVELMWSFGATLAGGSLVIERTSLLRHIEQLILTGEYRVETERRRKLTEHILRWNKSDSARRIELPVRRDETGGGKIVGVEIRPGVMEVQYTSLVELLSRLYEVAAWIQDDFEGAEAVFEGALTEPHAVTE